MIPFLSVSRGSISMNFSTYFCMLNISSRSLNFKALNSLVIFKVPEIPEEVVSEEEVYVPEIKKPEPPPAKGTDLPAFFYFLKPDTLFQIKTIPLLHELNYIKTLIRKTNSEVACSLVSTIKWRLWAPLQSKFIRSCYSAGSVLCFDSHNLLIKFYFYYSPLSVSCPKCLMPGSFRSWLNK